MRPTPTWEVVLRAGRGRLSGLLGFRLHAAVEREVVSDGLQGGSGLRGQMLVGGRIARRRGQRRDVRGLNVDRCRRAALGCRRDGLRGASRWDAAEVGNPRLRGEA